MRFSFFKSVIVGICVFLPGMALSAVSIAPNNSSIQYLGRFDQSNPLLPRCEWTGSHIKVAFTGTSVSATVVSNAKVYLDILVDSVRVKVDSATTVSRAIVCATGLANATHQLVIYVRSEDGILTFEGLTLDDGAAVASPGPQPSHKIEFIGDSYTVGYANEATNSGVCGNNAAIAAVTDNYRSWAPRAARACNAEYIEVAKSGWGLVRDCWTPATSDSTIATLYFRTLVNSKTPLWNFASWKPDLVCMCIGTNDFINCNTYSAATQLADSASFVKGYCAFLDTVRSKYSGVKIILNEPTPRPRVTNCVRQVVSTQCASGKTDVFYTQWQWDTTSNSMCWHPDILEDSLVGIVMADSIESIMKWNVSGVVKPVRHTYLGSPTKSLAVHRINGSTFTLETEDGQAVSGRVCVYRTNGELVETALHKDQRGGSPILCVPVKGVAIIAAMIGGTRLMSAPVSVY
jgi:hypothetical protein